MTVVPFAARCPVRPQPHIPKKMLDKMRIAPTCARTAPSRTPRAPSGGRLLRSRRHKPAHPAVRLPAAVLCAGAGDAR
eukprot:1238885-Prymnesium_polylepis.1